MSRITVELDFGGLLWPDHNASYSWGTHEASFRESGVSLITNVEISHKDQIAICEMIAALPMNFVPLWQTLPPNLHSTVLGIESQLRGAAETLDDKLRESAGALRLPTYKFRRQASSQIQDWPVVNWKFNDEEWERLKPLFEGLEDNHKRVLRNGVFIPLPDAFEGRQLHLNKEQLDELGVAVGAAGDTASPSYILYGAAWENFSNRSFPAAVVILAASIETALKSYLTERGGDVANYLIENIQSPPLDKLASCARKHAGLNIPQEFNSWLGQLANARNEIVHRPWKQQIDPLQLARWLAVGEAILHALRGVGSDPLVGRFIQVPEQIKDFPAGTRGVVLRREKMYGEDSLHVLLDSGVTNRFNPKAVEVLKD